MLRKHIEELVAERSTPENSDNFDFRLKQLAVVLAEMDGRSSFQLVMDILSIPETGTWLYGGWSRIHGLEALLMNGVVLPSAKTWEILEPVIQHARAHRYDSQQSSLLTHALCLVLFTNDACSDITRVRQMLQENLLGVEVFTQLTKAAGYSRCNDAVGLLRELADSRIRALQLGDTWIDAVAQFDTEEARNLLLGFVDPSLPTVPFELIVNYDGRLVARLG